MRYRTFCKEKGFEPAEHHPSGLEKDAYDRIAIHFLVQRQCPNQTTDYPATIRWIPGDAAPLPIEQISHIRFPRNPDRANVAELSRLIIRDACLKERGSIFSILIDHFLSFAKTQNTRYLLLLIRPSFVRMLHRRDIYPISFGPQIQYRGLRIPCYLDVRMHESLWYEKTDRRQPLRHLPKPCSADTLEPTETFSRFPVKHSCSISKEPLTPGFE
ncbi:MAG: GNAT family N-acyltransferase [Halorhodospira sp.]